MGIYPDTLQNDDPFDNAGTFVIDRFIHRSKNNS